MQGWAPRLPARGGQPWRALPCPRPPHPPRHPQPPPRPLLTVNDEPITPALTGQAEGLLQLHLGGHSAGVTWAARHTAEATAGLRPRGPHDPRALPQSGGSRAPRQHSPRRAGRRVHAQPEAAPFPPPQRRPPRRTDGEREPGPPTFAVHPLEGERLGLGEAAHLPHFRAQLLEGGGGVQAGDQDVPGQGDAETSPGWTRTSSVRQMTG